MELLKAIANSNAEQKISLLPQALEYGESGIDFLIECLGDRQLEVRAKAYELLQGIESEKVRQAISPGFLLNPGDKIYSVYQARIWFTDEEYCLFNGVDYLKDLVIQIYGDGIYNDEDLMFRSERIFFYINRDRAEHIAEVVHRDFIQQIDIDISSFKWQKENQNFDLKQWCLENNLISEQEWNELSIHQRDWRVEQLIRKSGDRILQEKYSKSKYIYKPEYIDTWCKDNQIEYDCNLDNWDNYRNLLDYLRLPENIELLSKFWKDCVGHFAFVKEEFICRTIHIRINEKLKNKTLEKYTSTKLIAKPRNYDKLAIEFLLKIIECDITKTKYKLKARRLLQNIDSDYIPF